MDAAALVRRPLYRVVSGSVRLLGMMACEAPSRPPARSAAAARRRDTIAAIRLMERTPYCWLAVGLVAGALMRQKTLDGSEVEALVRSAKDGE
jgi:hypothetical protein